MNLKELMAKREPEAWTPADTVSPSAEGWTLSDERGPCVVDATGKVVCYLDFGSVAFGPAIARAPAMLELLKQIAKGTLGAGAAREFVERLEAEQ